MRQLLSLFIIQTVSSIRNWADILGKAQEAYGYYQEGGLEGLKNNIDKFPMAQQAMQMVNGEGQAQGQGQGQVQGEVQGQGQ